MKNKKLVKTAEKKKTSSKISLSPSQKKIKNTIVKRVVKPSIENSPDIYRDIIENIHEGIFEVDLKGHFTFVNDAVCRATGFTKKKLTGMNSRPFTDKDDDKKVMRAYGTVYKTGIPVRGLGWHIIRKDDEKRYIEGSIYLRKDPKGKATGFRVIATDVTERKKMEDAYKIASLEWQETFDAVSDAICLMDNNQRIVRSNRAMFTMFGKSQKDLMGKHCWEIVHGTKKPIPECPIIKSKDSLKKEDIELKIKNKWLNVIVYPLLNDQKILSGFVHIIRDITEMKRAEESALKEYDFNRTVFDSLSVPFFMIDTVNWHFVRWNKIFPGLIGYSDEELAKFRPRNIIPKSEIGTLIKAQNKLLAEGHVSFEMPLVSKNGTTTPYLLSGTLLHYYGKSYLIGIGINLTERKKSEEALKQTEHKFRTIFDHASDGILLARSSDKKLIEANEKICQMLGYSKEELLQLDISNIHPKESASFITEQFISLIKKEISIVHDLPIIKKDGAIFFADVTASTIDYGGTKCLLGMFRDVTERKRAEESLRKSDARFKNLFENSPLGVFLLKDRKFTDVNPAFCEISGYSREELIGHSVVMGYKDEEEFERVGKFIYEEVEKNGIGIANARLKRKNGDLFDAMLYLSLVDAEDPSLGFQCILIDITERMQIEESLRYSEEKFALAFKRSPTAICITTLEEGRYIDANDSYLSNLGYKSEEIIGRTIFDINLWIDPSEPRTFINELLKTGSATNFELRVQDKQGNIRWGICSASIINISGKPHVLTQIIDITEQKLAEEKIRIEEQRFRGITQNMPGVIYQFYAKDNGEYGVSFISEPFNEFAQIMSKSEVEKLDSVFSDFCSRIHEEDKEKFLTSIKEAVENVSRWNFEGRVFTKSGQLIWIQATSIPTRLEDRVVFDGIILNITDRRNAEEAALKELNFSNTVLETLPGPYYMFDFEQARFFRWNRNMSIAAGYSDEELMHMTPFDLVPKSEHDIIIKAMEKIFNEGTNISEFNVVSKDGSTTPYLLSGNLLNHEGKSYVVGMGIDITERKKMDEALRTEQERFRIITEQSSDIIILINREGKIIYENPSIEKILGYNFQDRQGQNAFENIHPDDLPLFLDLFKILFKGETPPIEKAEARIRHTDGTWRTFEVVGGSLKINNVIEMVIANLRDITERKRVELSLRESEEKFRVLTESTPTAVMLYQNNKWIYANPAASEISGYSNEELLRLNFWDFVHPEDRQTTIERGQKRQKGEPVTTRYTLRIIAKDGTVKWIDLSGATITIGENPAGIISVMDITERKLAEEALQKSEANLRYAQEQAHVGSWEFDAVQQKPFWSDEMFRIVGRDPALGPMSLEDFVELVHPDERKRVYKDVAKCFTKNLPYHHEYRIFKPENKTAFIESRGNAITDDKGNVIRIFGILQDVTERKRTEKTLILIKKAVESSSDAIGMSDPQGHHFYHNKAFTELFEYTPEELDAVGGGPVIYLNKYTAHEVFDMIMKGGSWSGELEMISKSGRKFPVLLRADAIIDENGKLIGLIGVHTDITERKIAEEEIIRLNETLEQRIKERTAELEAFSYSVSHDLRAPLRTVHGFGQALLEDYENQLDEEAKGYLGRIKRATETMGELIEDMLKLSRITRAEMDIVPVNLSNIVKSIMEELQTSQPERPVDIKIADDIEEYADPRLMRIVFENLLTNSWKFTEKNDNTEIEFGLTVQDGRKVYFIRDNGAGFDMQYAGKLFTPFQRFHSAEEYSGTGIGLAIVKRIIARHGGAIWAKSKVGEGTTIFFNMKE